jgi:hypothetical protein
MGDGVFQRSDLILERPAVGTESSGRDWAGIGVGLAGAFALIAIFLAAMWALVVLVEASV